MKYFLIISLCIVSLSGQSQYAYKNNKTELVRRNGFMKLSGWNFAPGITFMGTRFRNTREELYKNGNISYDAIHDPGGRIGLYLEAGRHRIFKYSRLFPYMDYGLAYKGLRGKESYEGEWYNSPSETPYATESGSGKFANHNILAYVNFNNILQLTNRLFIQNSLGANVDYSIIVKSDNISGPYRNDVDLPRLWAQLHYKLGLGIKINDEFFIIPSVETPIFNINPWTDFRPKVNKFMSAYRPLIFSVRFGWLKQNTNDCPPVYDPANSRPDDPNYQ